MENCGEMHAAASILNVKFRLKIKDNKNTPNTETNTAGKHQLI